MADPVASPPLTRASVQAAHALIRPFVHRTPVLTSRTLSALASTPRSPADLRGTEWEGRTPARPVLRLWFKCENFQKGGAFKARGAFHALARLMEDSEWVEKGGRERGVVTHSSGNHAQALALAARTHGIPAHIVMPTISNPTKIAATKGYGADIIFSGSTSDEREAVCARVMADTGARLVPPYDHPHIVMGQGTMGLELQEQVEEMMRAGEDDSEKTKKSRKGLDAIITPCGGGGMLSGVALSCEGMGIKVFGSEPSFEGADDARRGYYSGERVRQVATLTIADGLRTPLGEVPWGIIYERRLVAGMFAVSEAEIKRALRLVLERMKVVIEPSAAVPLAVVLYNEEFRSMVEREAGEAGWDLGVVFSGGNVSLEALGRLFAPEAGA